MCGPEPLPRFGTKFIDFSGSLEMRLRASVAALLMLVGAQAGARELDLSLSNDTALLRYATPISYSGYGHTDADFGFMYTESNDVMVLGGIEMMGEAGSYAPGMHMGVGIKGYGVTLDGGDNVGSITLGVKGWYIPPEMSRMGVVAKFNFGPNVTTFGDAEKFWDFSTHVEYEVLPEAAVYVGYRNVRARLTKGRNAYLDKGWHLGLRMSF
jgi:hypothetical protein